MLQDPTIRNPIAIGFGAIAGALSRYYLTLWFAQRFGVLFPYGTFFINITGCFGMGFFVTLFPIPSASISPEIRLLVATGFLGAYTTFSTYSLETFSLLRNALNGGESWRSFLPAIVYWLGSAVLGIIGILMGAVLARLIK
ncbi:MAG: fluoride efflux transporter CrcB [Oscillatoria sp. SIO1A7]|nr:fluoride efflux transporter CrcB [Oscillatoria sp. SIO1A7]